MSDIFLSYSRQDLQRVETLVRAIESATGWSVWWDFRIRAGNSFDELIEQKLAECRCVLVAWSETSVGQRWVRAEAAEGLEREILVPVLLDQAKRPLQFKNVHAADLVGWQGDTEAEAFVRLIHDLTGLLGKPPLDSAPATVVEPANAPGKSPSAPVHPPAKANAGASIVAQTEAKPERPPAMKKAATPRTVGERSVPATETVSRRNSSTPKPAQPAQDPKLAKAVAAAGSKGASVIEPEMIRIQGGTFLMGSPARNLLLQRAGEPGRFDDERQHPVSVRDFSIGKYPATFDEYYLYCQLTGRKKLGNAGWGRGRRPVINVTWQDAYDYAAWLRERTGKPYRLASEAEWEYAARAGTTTAYWWGEEFDAAKASNGSRTTPVGEYPPNPWGLYDTSGNVWEWTGSVYAGSYDGSESRLAARDAEGARALRGGSWLIAPLYLRSAKRHWSDPDSRSGNIGFRLAQD